MQAFIILLIITFSFFSVKSSNLNIIRDAETENFLKEISNILIKDNNLEINNLNFFIDNKDFINAFVIPGQKIFLTKGLLMKSKKIEDLAGVIAHEIGHISWWTFFRKIKGCRKKLYNKYNFVNPCSRCDCSWCRSSRISNSFRWSTIEVLHVFFLFQVTRVTRRSKCNQTFKKIRFLLTRNA